MEKELILVESNKREIAKFYEQVFSDTKLKEKLEEKAKAIVNEEDLKKLIQQEIVPLMKKYNVNFSEEELLSYEEETLKELSEEALESVSGGRGFAIKPLLGLGILSLSMFGGIGLEAFAVRGSGNGKPGASQTASKKKGKTGTSQTAGKKKSVSSSSASKKVKSDDADNGSGNNEEESKKEKSSSKKTKKVATTSAKKEKKRNKPRRYHFIKKVHVARSSDDDDYDDDNEPNSDETLETSNSKSVQTNSSDDNFAVNNDNSDKGQSNVNEESNSNSYNENENNSSVSANILKEDNENIDSDNNNNDNIENDDNDNANDNNNNENDNDNANDNNNTDNAQQNDIKNGVKSYLERAENQNLENQNLIDESRENDYEQAKNENRIAIGGGHIFSYTLASSGNGVILTDIYTKVVDGILVIPPEVTTQDGHVRPVVGIRGEKFRTSKIKVVKLGPLTEIFFFEGDAESAFFGNKNIEKVDCSEAAKLKYLEIGDSAFEDSSLKSIVAPPQEVKIVTGVNAYAWAPIEDYVSYLLSLDSQKTSGFWGFFKKASDTIIDKANHVLNKLKSIINLSCLNNSFMISELKDDLNSVVGAIGSSELDSLEQSDCDLLLNAATLFELGDYDSQINVKPSKIGNNNNDSNNSNDDDNNNNDNGDFSDNDNDNNTGGDDNSGDDNNNNNNNDNDDNNGDFNDHSGNNNDNDNDDDHNNSQGPEEFVASNGNSEASEQQSDNESQEIQAKARMEVNYSNEAAASENEDNNDVVAKENSEASEQQSDNESQEIQAKARMEVNYSNEAAASENEDNNDVVAKENSEASEEEIQAGVTDDDDDKSHKKISVDEFLARGSLSSDNEDDVAFVKRFITQNPVKDLKNKINRETAQEIVKILDNFFEENSIGQGYTPDKSMVSNYMISLGSTFDVSIIESNEKNDNFSGSDDNRNYNDNSSDSSKHDDNDNDDDNDDDDTPKKLKTKKIKINSNKKRISSKTKSKTSAKTGNKKKINAKNSDIGLKNADNDNSKEPEVAAMPEESNNNALKQEVVAKEESNNNNQKPEAVVATEENSNANNSQEPEVMANQNDNSNNNAPGSNNKDTQPKETKEKAKDSATKTENSFSWELTDAGILTISGSGPMPDYGSDFTKFPWYPRNEIIKEINISEGITEISALAFHDYENLDKVSLPGSLKIVGSRAFNGCVNLVNINLPQSLKEIKYSAFENCKSLTNVKLPGKLVSLENNAFKCCAGLTKISIPASVTSVGSAVFDGCNNLTELGINSDVVASSLEEVFGNTKRNIQKITLGKDVTTNVNVDNLVDCKNLKEFAVDAGNEKFKAVDGMLVFKDEEGLTLICCPQGKTGSITVPGNITKIGPRTFFNCGQLTEITLENGVKEIEQNAFRGCAKNLSINIPVSLISIENIMMGLYFNLQFNSNEEIDKLYNNAEIFDKIAPFVRKITLGEDVKYIEDDIFADFSYLQAIEVDSNNQDYTSVDGVLYSKDGQTIERYPVDKSVEVFVIPMGVIKIAASAFAGVKNLRAVPMPPTVNWIGAEAFAESGTTSVYIPRAVKKISYGTFQGCKGLNRVYLSEGLKVIEDDAFKGCNYMREINFPESLEAIGKDALKVNYSYAWKSNVPDLPTTYVEEDIVDDVEEKEAAPISTANIDDDDDSTTNNVKKESKKDKNSKKTRVKQSSRGRGRGGKKGSTPTRGGARKNIKANKSGDNDGDINLNKNEEDEDIADNNDKKSSKEEKSSNKKRKLIKKKPGRNFIAKKTDENKVEKNKAEETIDDSDDDDDDDFEVDNDQTIDNESSKTKKGNMTTKKGKYENYNWEFDDESTGTLAFGGKGKISIGSGTWNKGSRGRPWSATTNDGRGIKKIVVRDGITEISEHAFEGHPDLEEVEIAGSVKVIGPYAFMACPKLKTVKLGNGVTEIGDYTFENCTSLKSINIPSSVQTIGDSAFFNCCDEMESIEIPSSVETIGKRAFKRCHSLSYVTFSGDNHQLKTIPEEMFNDCLALSAIVLPPSVQTIEEGAFPDNVKIIKMPQ